MLSFVSVGRRGKAAIRSSCGVVRVSKGLLAISLTACVWLGACGDGGSPMAPGPTASPYAGEWRGTTSQGQPISFVVSADAKVTNVTVGYAFSGCSGVETLSGLAESIMLPVTQFGTTLPDGRGIGFTFVFLSDRIASGGVVFYGPSGCGSTGDGGPFNATKR